MIRGKGSYGEVIVSQKDAGILQKKIQQKDPVKAQKMFQKLTAISKLLKQMNQGQDQKYFAGLLLPDSTPFLYKMKDGGYSLEHWVKHSSPSKLRVLQKQWLDAFPSLFIAVKKLNSRKLVHRDIKMDNIVWEDQKKKLSLIDYDILITQDKVKPRVSPNDLRYWYPPDFFLPSIYPYYLKTRFFHKLPSNIRNQFQSFLSLNKQIQMIASKIDLFSLGMVILRCFSSVPSASFQKELETIVLLMIHPDPIQRRFPTKTEWQRLKQSFYK